MIVRHATVTVRGGAPVLTCYSQDKPKVFPLSHYIAKYSPVPPTERRRADQAKLRTWERSHVECQIKSEDDPLMRTLLSLVHARDGVADVSRLSKPMELPQRITERLLVMGKFVTLKKHQ